MFAPFLGFENLSLQVEVEYQERKRLVVARVAQVPDAPDLGTLVCSFADTSTWCEWVLLLERDRKLDRIYSIGNPSKYLCSYSAPGKEQVATKQAQWHPQRVKKLERHIRDAFCESRSEIVNAQAIELVNLPHAPQIVVLKESGNYWCDSWPNNASPTLFVASLFDLNAGYNVTCQRLQEQWFDNTSDVRFAWGWANWSREERSQYALGLRYSSHEAKQIMKWILYARESLWEINSSWSWSISKQINNYGLLQSQDGNQRKHSSLDRWQEWLYRYFIDEQAQEQRHQHLCIALFWQDLRNRESVVVVINDPPSAHERLEARLQLRDWLQGKATPDEIKRLLDE